jgi:hypothetical protein
MRPSAPPWTPSRRRKPQTARRVQQAFFLGKVFHHAPRTAACDAMPSSTGRHSSRKWFGECSPGEIIGQLAAIDEAEDRFTALRAAT